MDIFEGVLWCEGRKFIYYFGDFGGIIEECI